MTYQELKWTQDEAMAAGGRLSSLRFVESSRKPGFYYLVDVEEGTCTCPDYAYRCRKEGTLCKHLKRFADGKPEQAA